LNPKLQKITDEIEKIKRKTAGYQSRLRELERQRTEIENADIIAMVRGVDIKPEDFTDFVRAFKEGCAAHAVPDTLVKPKEEQEDSTL